MNKILVILYLILVLIFFISIYFYDLIYNKNNKNNKNIINTISPTLKPINTEPIIIPNITIKPRITTQYPLTEQAIMLTFPNSQYTNFTKYDRNIFNNLLLKNMNQKIVDKIPQNKNVSLDCYVLYSNTFIPEVVNNQITRFTSSPIPDIYNLLDNPNYIIDNKYDINSYINPQTLPPIILKVEENKDEYDSIGAYFFLNFKKFLKGTRFENCQPTYYDYTKKIVINIDCLTAIYDNIKGYDSKQRNFFTSLSLNPMKLDDFVPLISKFLFYGYGVNQNTIGKYKDMELTC